MAVVQISKIQVRRGKKNQTNIPQLSGGEFGWAVDTQQLYIGNGSVSEGAPFVGNTEILTERSNIFGLLGAYSFEGYLLDNNGNSVVQTSDNPNTPFGRSLQEKLDDVINVRDFGVIGDYENGVGTNDTAAIQRAIDQIFLNSSNKAAVRSRRKLFFPAGTYKITDTLYIPSNATLIGDGIDKTIFIQDIDTKSIIKTVSTSSTPGNYAVIDSSPTAFNNNTTPTNVYIEGITFLRKPGSTVSTPIAYLDCLTNSIFERCKFEGVWSNGTGDEVLPVVTGSNSAVVVRGLGAVTTENVVFNRCEFTKVTHAVYSDYDSTRVSFKNCNFKFLFRGLTLAYGSTNSAGKSYGPDSYTVEDCVFDKIDAEAIKVYATASSRGHKSVNNRFLDVGNNSFGQSQPAFPVLDLSVPNCSSTNDYFQRNIDVNNVDLNKATLNSSMIAYVPDVLGVETLFYPAKSSTLIYNTQDTSPKILLKVPAWSSIKVTIDYTIKKPSSSLYRSGQVVINANPNMIGTSTPPTITDNFSFVGIENAIGTVTGGNIRFVASLMQLSAVSASRDAFGNWTTTSTAKPTLVVRYINPAGPGSDATINYSVTVTSGSKDFV